MIDKSEINRVLEAGIITSTSSAWNFSVVIDSKKEGVPSFCVEYHVLNQNMKADRWPITKVQEIFYQLKEGYVFTQLYLLSVYWKVRFVEECKEKKNFVCRCGTFQFYHQTGTYMM